jgi:uncharacterized protein YndB with AHSA1/START domain
MATHVERDIFVNVPPQTLFEYGMDATRAPEWYEGVIESTPDGTWPQVGGKAEQVYSTAGARFDMTVTVKEFVPNKRFVFEMDGMIKGTYQWDYMPEGNGTRLKATVDYEMKGGALGQLANKLVVEKMNTSNLEKSLQNLKNNLE